MMPVRGILDSLGAAGREVGILGRYLLVLITAACALLPALFCCLLLVATGSAEWQPMYGALIPLLIPFGKILALTFAITLALCYIAAFGRWCMRSIAALPVDSEILPRLRRLISLSSNFVLAYPLCLARAGNPPLLFATRRIAALNPAGLSGAVPQLE